MAVLYFMTDSKKQQCNTKASKIPIFISNTITKKDSFQIPSKHFRPIPRCIIKIKPKTFDKKYRSAIPIRCPSKSDNSVEKVLNKFVCRKVNLNINGGVYLFFYF